MAPGFEKARGGEVFCGEPAGSRNYAVEPRMDPKEHELTNEEAGRWQGRAGTNLVNHLVGENGGTKVFGGTPNTARETRALPINCIVTASGGGAVGTGSRRDSKLSGPEVQTKKFNHESSRNTNQRRRSRVLMRSHWRESGQPAGGEISAGGDGFSLDEPV